MRLHPRWVALLGARFVDAPDSELVRHQHMNNLRKTDGALAGYVKRGLAQLWHERDIAPFKSRMGEDLSALLARAEGHYKLRHEDELFEAAVQQWRHQEAVRRLFSAQSSRATA